MAAKLPVKIVDPTTDANEWTIDASGHAEVSIEDAPTGASAIEVQGTAADGAAAVGDPVQVGGIDGGGLIQTLSVTSTGSLNVTVASGGTDNIEFGNTGALAAGANADVDTADIATAPATLKQITVAGEQPFFFEVAIVENAVETIKTAQIHGSAGESVIWAPAGDSIQIAATSAGLDAFRASVTNNDNNKTATFYVTFEFQN